MNPERKEFLNHLSLPDASARGKPRVGLDLKPIT